MCISLDYFKNLQNNITWPFNIHCNCKTICDLFKKQSYTLHVKNLNLIDKVKHLQFVHIT
jgi:hypothetical protein